MGYQFFNGSWKKNASGQRINESSIVDDEETDEHLYNIEIGTTAIECLVLEVEVQEHTEREPPAPPMVTSSVTIFADASTFEPSMS